MAVEKINLHKSPPPANDDWKPQSKTHKKKHGLVIFTKPLNHWFYDHGILKQTNNTSLRESIAWYETERDRDNAIAKANKDMNGRWSVPLALAKIER
jgi:hypothetical protein